MKKTIIIAGEAGAGINTSELFIERMLKQNGFRILSYKNYMSRVRGGFNFATITLDQSTVHSCEDHADIFIALNQEAFENSQMMIKAEGLIIASSNWKSLTYDLKKGEVLWIDEEALKAASTSKNAFSMAAIGLTLQLVGIDKKETHQLALKKWTEAVNENNIKAADFGYALSDRVLLELPTREISDQMLINGNQAVALGALAAGLSFYSAYPMAPSTGIMNYLMAHESEMGIVVEQAEDEISAVMSAIGASSNGVRAMTGTSGGGFALMVESVGFAAVSEVPIVICNVQRPGPATGLPTRTEQADLSFVVSASQGEFSRIVMAPTTVQDAFYDTFRAFNLSDKYQIPVLILTDQLLGDSTQSVDRFDLEHLKIERYLLEDVVKDYKRYDFNNLYGNRKYPGIDLETLIMTDSHVHDEYGHVTEEGELTVLLKNKFLRRTEALKTDLKKPVFYGVDDYDTLMICWGSTFGALKDAVDQLNHDGAKSAMLTFTDVFPLNEHCLTPYLDKNPVIVNVEGNAFNQFGKLLRMETGVAFHHSINKFDGRPFTAEFIIEKYNALVKR